MKYYTQIHRLVRTTMANNPTGAQKKAIELLIKKMREEGDHAAADGITDILTPPPDVFMKILRSGTVNNN